MQLPINPRYGIPALSWSDVVAIENDIGRWASNRKLHGDHFDFGTYVHALIKHRKLKVPHGNAPEQVYQRTIKDGKRSFIIVGKPDDTDDDTIYEYKSAKNLWSKHKSDNHGQIPTYALLRWGIVGYPKKGKLISLETKHDEDAGIYLTGEQRVVDVVITLTDVLNIQVRFINAYRKVLRYQPVESTRLADTSA